MPKAKKRIFCAQKTSFCPDCGKHFANLTNVLRHMNQPSNTCSFVMNGVSYQPHASRSVQELHQSHAWVPDLFNEPLNGREEMWECNWEDSTMSEDTNTDSAIPDAASDIQNVEYYPGVSTTYGQGTTFMAQFFTDKYADLRHDNPFYLFASQEDWQPGSWLLWSGLSMVAINSFLSLNLVSTLNHLLLPLSC